MTSLTKIIKKDRFIHSIKTAIAVLIGFILTKTVKLAVDQWLLITIIVVMCAQINVGSIIQKSSMRFLGTLTGTLVAVFTLTFFDSNAIATAIVITLSCMFFSFIATSQKNYNESGTLGAVTVIIILISPNPTLTIAAIRFLEISVGILIAALVSQLILPIHARKNLRINQAHTLRQIKQFYQTALMSKDLNMPIQHLDEDIVKSLISQRKLALEAVREPFGKAYNVKLFKQSLWCEKEIIRCIMFMHHAYETSPEFKKKIFHLQAITQFNQDICQALDVIADNLENKLSSPIITIDIQLLKETIHSLIKILNSDEIVCANVILFCAGILAKQIEVIQEPV